MTDTEMRLEAGSVVALRFYDLGRKVDVDTLASRMTGEVERPQFPAGAGLRYQRAPVEIALDDVDVTIEDGSVFADATLRVFDFGVAVLALRALVGGLDWDRFTDRVDDIASAVSGRSRAWADAEQRARAALQRARIDFEGGATAEHVFVIARRLSHAVPIDELVDGDYAASIVSRDWMPLTSIARADLLRGARVSGRNLIVAGDERTFIVEPDAGSGVPDTIEAALAQRTCFEGAASQSHARARDGRAGRAAALVFAERGGSLSALFATARDRLGITEAEASAARRAALAPRASVSWLRIVVIAAVTALVTSILVVALS